MWGGTVTHLLKMSVQNSQNWNEKGPLNPVVLGPACSLKVSQKVIGCHWWLQFCRYSVDRDRSLASYSIVSATQYSLGSCQVALMTAAEIRR